jgi:hypothetical protein
MKPIVDKITYKEISPEDLERFRREAEVMRTEEVHKMFAAIYRGVGHAVVRLGRTFRAVVSNPGIHTPSRAR